MCKLRIHAGEGGGGDTRRSDMPAAQVEFDDGNEALGGVVDLGNGQQHLGMTHEACKRRSAGDRYDGGEQATNLVILSNMLRGSRMKVGRTTRLRSAPGRSWEMMCMRTTVAFSARQHSTKTHGLGGGGGTHRCPDRARRRGCHLRLRHRTRNGYLKTGAVSVLFGQLVSPGLRAGSDRTESVVLAVEPVLWRPPSPILPCMVVGVLVCFGDGLSRSFVRRALLGRERAVFSGQRWFGCSGLKRLGGACLGRL